MLCLTEATSVVFVICTSMLSPFPGYVLLERLGDRHKTMFHISQDLFTDYRFHICTSPSNSMHEYCLDSGSQVFLRSDPHVGYFVLIYWCDCTVQSLFLFQYSTTNLSWCSDTVLVYFFFLYGNILYWYKCYFIF